MAAKKYKAFNAGHTMSNVKFIATDWYNDAFYAAEQPTPNVAKTCNHGISGGHCDECAQVTLASRLEIVGECADCEEYIREGHRFTMLADVAYCSKCIPVPTVFCELCDLEWVAHAPMHKSQCNKTLALYKARKETRDLEKTLGIS